MADQIGHWLAALLLTYGVSRVLRRAPLAAPEPRRSVIVHVSAAVLVCVVVYALHPLGSTLIAPLVTQLGWLLLDIARARSGAGRRFTARAG